MRFWKKRESFGEHEAKRIEKEIKNTPVGDLDEWFDFLQKLTKQGYTQEEISELWVAKLEQS